MIKGSPGHIVISRNDAVGDVILALPACGIIKKHYPLCRVSILGRTYTRDAALSSTFVDGFINQDDWTDLSERQAAEVLKKENVDVVIFFRPDKRLARISRIASIPVRIGTANRLYHWANCNKLIPLSRKNSPLHEAQLNLKLLKGINIYENPTLNELPPYYGLTRFEDLSAKYDGLLCRNKLNLILHPKSNGNSLEWGLHNFSALISMLDTTRVNILISGSAKEKAELFPWIENEGDKVTDITGLFSLTEFMSFISKCDGLVAASTGPIHIAAAAGIHALGLYTDIKTKQGGRWGPIGRCAEYLQCTNADMNTITPEAVFEKIESWLQ